MSVISRLKHMFSSSLTWPALLQNMQTTYSQEEIAEKSMFAVITLVDCFRAVFQPELQDYRFKELPGSAFNARELQYCMQTQTGWKQSVALSHHSQGRILVTEELPGCLQTLVSRPVDELLNACWIHFMYCYDTRGLKAPLVGCAAPLAKNSAWNSEEPGLCVPIRIMHPSAHAAPWEETRVTVGFSSNLLAFLLGLELPGRSTLEDDFTPRRATLHHGARWMDDSLDDFHDEEVKKLAWPGDVLAQTMLMALAYGSGKKEA